MPILIVGGNPTDRLTKARQFNTLEFEAGGIDDIRQLEKIISTGQAVSIKNAQNLTPQSQNAFLKTLEEAQSDIVLLADNEDQLLPTVVSRCFVINLPPGKTGGATQKVEDIKTREEALEFIDRLMLTRPYKILRRLFQLKKCLKANANVRLALDNLP